MTTATKAKTERTLTLSTMTHGKLLLTIVKGKLTSFYTVTPVPSDFGTAFCVGRFSEEGTSEVYNVCIDGANSQCDCIGFQHRGMNTKDGRGCKHIAALTTLLQLGKLPQAEPKAAPKYVPSQFNDFDDP